jgi:hypothetical protein
MDIRTWAWTNVVHRIYLCLHGHDDPVLCVAIARL